MKVIASTSSTNSTYLVEASVDELAQIMGYASHYQMPGGRERTPFNLGQEIKVSDLFKAISYERERADELKQIEAGLRKVADKVAHINTTCATPIIEGARS